MLDATHIAEQDKVRVLNYNTLCRHYCTPALYGYSSAEALSWEHRREVIMAELRAREADIMCLQEVEHDAFETYFRPSLAHLDYRGVFWPKGRAKTMAPTEAKMVDGCATFYKSSKYVAGMCTASVLTAAGTYCSTRNSSICLAQRSTGPT